MKTLLLSIVLLSICSGTVSFAQGNLREKNHNRAAVLWSPFDDVVFRPFRSHLMTRIVSDDNKKTYFNIPYPNFREVGSKQGDIGEFKQKLSEALSTIREDHDPEMFVFIATHGRGENYFHGGKMRMPEGPMLDHDQFVNALFDQVDVTLSEEQKRKVTLNIFYLACHSSSMIPSVEKRLKGSKNSIKVNFFATASASHPETARP